MKYVDEFRDRHIIDKLAAAIRREAGDGRAYNFMEVCGTHTMNIFRFALKDILPKHINLISGPGCPVCVTPNEFIDKAIWLANRDDVIIATFGDMFKVPGSRSSLEKEKARGAEIKMVYSSIDALSLAKSNPDKEVVFLGIGFETTVPTVAQSILIAKHEKIRNYSVLCGHKTMPEALKLLAEDKNVNIDGFLLPGHVSAIIGSKPYEFLAKQFGKKCVIAGFEPVDILQAILMLTRQASPKIDIQYTRIINRNGNRIAQKTTEKVFRKTDSVWRGIGKISGSGQRTRDEFSEFDAESKFKPKIAAPREDKGCFCGEILKGTKTPFDCRLFGKACKPENPVGACMVSSEGTCAAYYKYIR
ncbi:MAG: hydrogenase formation protein HypD [Candidatus Omnitrophota bacterium]|nr:hydrogenase formation protein HypD [Candidatus Omnitrophota bacterium]